MPSGFGDSHTNDGGSQNGKTARFKNTPQKQQQKTNKKKTSAVSTAL